MNVFVVFHADIEDDRYVRGVFATAEVAEAFIPTPDVRASEDLKGRHVSWREHNEWCCGVEEWDVQEALPLGPPEPETPVDYSGGFVIPNGLIERWLQSR